MMNTKYLHLKNKLTIGVAIYNDKYLNKLLKSLSRQTISKDILYIFSNDNFDNDKIRKLLNKFKSSYNCKIFNNKPKKGPMQNHIFITEKIKTPYFMFISDDDYLYSNSHLENLLINAINQNLDFIMPNIKILENKKIQDFKFKKEWSKTNFTNFFFMTLKESGFLFYSLFNTKILKKYTFLLRKNKSNTHYNEGAFIHAIALNQKGLFFKKESLVYRLHEENLSKKPKHQVKCFLDYLQDSILMIMKNKKISLNKRIYCIIIFTISRIKYLNILILKVIINFFLFKQY